MTAIWSLCKKSHLLQTLLIAATPDEAILDVKTLPQNLSMPSVTVLDIDALTKVRPPGIFIKKVLNIKGLWVKV